MIFNRAISLWAAITMLLCSACEMPPANEEVTATQAAISGFNAQGRDAAISILARGGNAADAFISATFIDYVVAPGVTSLAGPLMALAYDRQAERVDYFDGGLKTVAALDGQYEPGLSVQGKAVLIPGALHALEKLWQEKGSMPWADLIEPAKQIALEGFEIDTNYSFIIASRTTQLKSSSYGEETFFTNTGDPLAPGDVLRQPELAEFLGDVQVEGSLAMYEGEWATTFVDAVNARGGMATLEDLSTYSSLVSAPLVTQSRGHTIYSSLGNSWGGTYVALCLEVLEHAPFAISELSEVDRLEIMIRVSRAAYEQPWVYSERSLEQIERQLQAENTRAIWERVASGSALSPLSSSASHSYHVSVVDAEGNAVSGTNTINSLSWGEGIFVRGVPLNSAGFLYQPGPAARVFHGTVQQIIFDSEGRLSLVGGSFGGSLLELQLQLSAAVLHEDLEVADLAMRPRFGTFPFDYDNLSAGSDFSANWIDKDLDPSVVDALEARGLSLDQDPRGDLGLPSVLIREDEKWVGIVNSHFLDGGVSVLD